MRLGELLEGTGDRARSHEVALEAARSFARAGLLTVEDLSRRSHHANAQRALRRLLEFGALRNATTVSPCHET